MFEKVEEVFVGIPSGTSWFILPNKDSSVFE